jgi:hypothetical protein
MNISMLRSKVIAVSFALAFGSLAPAAAMAADVHSHGAGAVESLKLHAGKKWASDAPLRKGTTEIRNAIAANKDAIHAGKLTDAAYDALAAKIDAQVSYLVTNCKLPADADAQLHLVLAQVMQGTSAMKGKEKTMSRRAGVESIVQALEAYSRHFDHPGWKKLG